MHASLLLLTRACILPQIWIHTAWETSANEVQLHVLPQHRAPGRVQPSATAKRHKADSIPRLLNCLLVHCGQILVHCAVLPPQPGNFCRNLSRLRYTDRKAVPPYCFLHLVQDGVVVVLGYPFTPGFHVRAAAAGHACRFGQPLMLELMIGKRPESAATCGSQPEYFPSGLLVLQCLTDRW